MHKEEIKIPLTLYHIMILPTYVVSIHFSFNKKRVIPMTLFWQYI